MKIDATVTVFTVSPIADPARGGRWCSVQVWADQGTIRVHQLCEVKCRLLTPEERDASAEVQEIVRVAVAMARQLAGRSARLDTITLDGKSIVEV